MYCITKLNPFSFINKTQLMGNLFDYKVFFPSEIIYENTADQVL